MLIWRLVGFAPKSAIETKEGEAMAPPSAKLNKAAVASNIQEMMEEIIFTPK
jgi:hypothetical protein